MDPVTSIVSRHIDAGAFTGASVAIARGPELILEVHAGDAAPGLPASADVIWPLASISKVFTAAMTMRLVERGDVTVNTHVGSVLPRFTSDGRDEGRLRHLLTHTSGLPYESPEMGARLAARTPIEAIVDEAYAAPLMFRPGTRFAYSDYGYLMIGQMAEAITGRPFADLVQDFVCEPMGLADTSFAPPPTWDGRIAYVSQALAEGTDGAMYNSAYARALAHPAFGTVSSLADMVRFGQHFAPGGPRIHAEATVRAMSRSQTGGVPGVPPLPGGYGSDCRVPWGYGFEMQDAQVPAMFSELASFSAFGHGGASGCELIVDPEQDLVIVVLSNTHLLSGQEDWLARLQGVVTAAYVFATTPP